MEFTKYSCPVCGKQFTKEDDIVVCPECGAPHHRECYEKNGKCFYSDKHSDDFSFEEISAENEAENETEGQTIICPNCKAENPKEMFYCQKCGFPLNEQDRKQNTTEQQKPPFQSGGIPPFGMPFGTNPQQMNTAFDPMAGMKSDDKIGDNVTAGEVSKFVGKNTQYFLRIFSNIKNYDKSRFNFSAFLFSGAYFLYRKMIVLGIIISFIIIGLTVGSTLIQFSSDYRAVYDTVYENMKNVGTGYGFSNYSSMLNGLSQNDTMLFFAPSVLELLKYITMFVSGFAANRIYFKHCIKKINRIKSENENVNINEKLETSGGVNLALAMCIGAAYLIITYIPLFIQI